MLYKEVTNRIFDNLDIKEDANTLNVVKGDIQDIIKEAYSLSNKPIKDTQVYNITSANNSQVMPNDFYLPLQVIFKNPQGGIVVTSEITYEEFRRWDTQTVTSIIEQISDVNNPGIGLSYMTSENVDYDGSVGFYFNSTFDSVTNNNTTTLYWKPSFTGTLQISYVFIPLFNSTIRGEKGLDINPIFSDLIVTGATLKGYKRRLSRQFKTELDFVAVREAIKIFTQDYKEMLGRFIGYINTTSETQQIKFFDFLDDPSMRIL